jgi:hypothetical protein
MKESLRSPAIYWCLCSSFSNNNKKFDFSGYAIARRSGSTLTEPIGQTDLYTPQINGAASGKFHLIFLAVALKCLKSLQYYQTLTYFPIIHRIGYHYSTYEKIILK